MRYAGINYNDFCAAPGVSLSVYVQGCGNQCEGCHNPETWDFNGGKEFTDETMNNIVKKLNDNGFLRNLAIMGGEPLDPRNIKLTKLIITKCKEYFPQLKIYLWTGFIYEKILGINNKDINEVLNNIDILIDGPFILSQRDIRLKMRGSTNQRIINVKQSLKEERTILLD